MLSACGGAAADRAREPPSTWRDPPGRAPPADPAAAGGDAPTGVIAMGGSEAARSLVVSLLEAVLDGDLGAAESTLSERVASASPVRAGAPRTAADRSSLVRHWITLGRSAHVAPETDLGALVDVGSFTVEPAGTHYGRDERPSSIEETDLVVRFTVTDLGRRALAGLAPGGVGVLVVRPGPEPQIIAR